MSERKTASEHVRDYYRSQSLDPTARARIERLVELGSGPDRAGRSTTPSRVGRWFAAAGLVAAMVFVGIALQRFVVEARPLASRIGEEIALNHGKQLAVEFTASSYRELARQMDKLDFELTAPLEADIAGLPVLGARYCSIQGELAAQVKLLGHDGHTFTLYQTALTDELHALPASEQHTDQIRIRIWAEGDRLLGLARSVE